MKKTENQDEVQNVGVEAEARQEDARVEKEYSGEDQTKQDTAESFHDSMIRQATQENKEKLLAEVKKVILKSLLERKAMVREMERIDAQISQHDAKLERLTHLVETDQIIEASEVRAFMQSDDVAGFLVMDIETIGFAPMKLSKEDLGYTPSKARALAREKRL